MGSQQERSPEKENDIVYDLKATRALEFARERVRTEDRGVVSYEDLIEGINSQITPQEKLNIYKAYEIDYEIEEYGLKLATELTVVVEHLYFARLDLARLDEAHCTDTVLQSSPLAQRAIQYAEELAALKDNKTLNVYDLFAGVVKVAKAEDERAAQQMLPQTSVL